MAYPGGKNGSGVYQKIINQMPLHSIYIEPFLGHGAIMRLKRPAISSIGIDADSDVISAWHSTASLGSVPPNLTLLQGDAIAWLASHAKDGDMINTSTLIYLDPPYLISTRRQHRPIYLCELSEKDHERLLSIIKDLPCMVMISGYWSHMYAKALKDWRTVTFTARTRGGSIAHEWLWMNFSEPIRLHDYQFLGDNFRERERIKRKRQRWERRLKAMPALERYAILSSIAEMSDARASPAVAIGAGDHQQK
jgi:DNA adenine methylase